MKLLTHRSQLLHAEPTHTPGYRASLLDSIHANGESIRDSKTAGT